MLSSCSTVPVVVPVPTPKTEPFPAEHMIKCEDLPVLGLGMTADQLVQRMLEDQTQYNNCKETHNKLVDQINKRVQGPKTP